MKSLEVFPGSSILVKGKIKPSSILLIGPTGSGKTVFCKHFLFNGLMIGEPCIYVTTSETPKEIESSMMNFGMYIKPFKEKKLVRIVDGCSWKSGKKTSSEYAVDAQQNYLTAISISLASSALEMTPKVSVPTKLPGVRKLTWLKALKSCTLSSSKFPSSVIRVLLMKLRSQTCSPGADRILRPELPNH